MCVRALVKKEIVPASGESIRDCGFIFFQKKSLILSPAASTNSFFWREKVGALAPQQPVNRIPHRPTVTPSVPPA
jgi:hypothetical protein